MSISRTPFCLCGSCPGGVLSEAIDMEADMDGDLRVSVAEAVHAMRVAAGFPVTVDSLLDLADPPAGTTTIRAALERAAPGQPTVFDPSLDGGKILLSIVGQTHSILKGEVMGMEMTPSGPVSYLEGYFERDYGRSALYAKKDVVIDASGLDSGIALEWTGGESEPARVLAIYGDLALLNVDITGGRSIAEDIWAREPEDQPWTPGRGGAVAFWGKAVLEDCALYDNHCVGDFDQSRDRGAFGGGLYTDIVEMKNCVASGNTVTGAGAAGGGVYSVGGAEHYHWTSYIEQASIGSFAAARGTTPPATAGLRFATTTNRPTGTTTWVSGWPCFQLTGPMADAGLPTRTKFRFPVLDSFERKMPLRGIFRDEKRKPQRGW